MAQLNNNGNNNNDDNSVSQQQLVNPVFHDFLGMKKPIDSPLLLARKTADARLLEPSPSSVSVVASSAGGAARVPFSTTSDIGSERQVTKHLDGVPFHGPRSDFPGTEMGSRLVGNKRSNSDSTFMSSSRDAFQVVPDSLQNSHLMKILRNAAGGEQLKSPNDDEVLLGIQSLKPIYASQIFQPPADTKIDANKWERSVLINVGPSMQHPSRGNQLTPFMHRIASNKLRDTNAGPSFISQSAADEGSRTGIKGSSILSSMNAPTEKTSSPVLLGESKPKPVINIIDPESSTHPSRHGLTSASHQMTIFYGGQAHVFDDIQPNKADIIMALAGSIGGSWSTTFSPKSAAKQVHDNNLLSGENETVIVSNMALPQEQELHRRLSITGSSSHAFVPGDRVSTPTGARQRNVLAKDTRHPVQAASPSSEDKRAK